MPIIDEVGRKHWGIRLLIAGMYLFLAVLGVTMVYPFMITLTSATATSLDYQRFAPFPRAVYVREDRFMRGLVRYYPELFRGALEQLAFSYDGVQPEWTTWQSIGKDIAGSDAFARRYLQQAAHPARRAQLERMAADYSRFASRYPLEDTLTSFNDAAIAPYLRARYQARVAGRPGVTDVQQAAIEELGRQWQVIFKSFYEIRTDKEKNYAWDLPTFVVPQDARGRDFLVLCEGYRELAFFPGNVRGAWHTYLRGRARLAALNQRCGTRYARWRDVPFPVLADAPAPLRALWWDFKAQYAPMNENRPYLMKLTWLKWLGTAEGRRALGLAEGGTLTLAEFNRACGTQYATLRETPFPVPPTAPAMLYRAYQAYVGEQYPLRLMAVRVTPALQAQFSAFIRDRFKGNLQRCNSIVKMQYASWEAMALTPRLPAPIPGTQSPSHPLGALWLDFVQKHAPLSAKVPLSAEQAYQAFLLRKYRSLDEINRQYGWTLTEIEQAEMPLDAAYLVTFLKHEGTFFWDSIFSNYAFVLDYLVFRGRALWNTLILIVLFLLMTLSVNPLAAYALSRFQLRQTHGVILFLLATMAFPYAVSMIPGFLLMRDLHLLNTYWALVLPGLANGMSIFLLKGFFDSLPPELYEAAALDGAQEWQVFTRITLPLSKPILAVIALNAFMTAYNSWEWAIVVCQKSEMWTVAVWLFQFNSQYQTMPWAVMAAFVVASVPTFLVFLLCQNIILRGIILPQMK